MKHYNLRNEAQVNGGFTDLFILGTNRNTNNTSDFTAAALTQTFTLYTLAKGDQIVFPLVAAWLKRSFSDTAAGLAPATLANYKLDIGGAVVGNAFFSGGTNGDLIQTLNPVPDSNLFPISAVTAAATPVACTVAGNRTLTATITGTAGNLSTVTFGEVWIYAAISRSADWMRDRDA